MSLITNAQTLDADGNDLPCLARRSIPELRVDETAGKPT